MSKSSRRLGTRAAADVSDFEFHKTLDELPPEQPSDPAHGRCNRGTASGRDPAMSGSDLLVRATYRGNPVEVGLATDAELAVIAGCVLPASTRDLLDVWSIVAIRDPDGRGTATHALGWRVALGNTWITSALVGVALQALVVSTRSGHAYQLGTEDVPGLSPALLDHLAYALHTWGFADVES